MCRRYVILFCVIFCLPVTSSHFTLIFTIHKFYLFGLVQVGYSQCCCAILMKSDREGYKYTLKNLIKKRH